MHGPPKFPLHKCSTAKWDCQKICSNLQKYKERKRFYHCYSYIACKVVRRFSELRPKNRRFPTFAAVAAIHFLSPLISVSSLSWALSWVQVMWPCLWERDFMFYQHLLSFWSGSRALSALSQSNTDIRLLANHWSLMITLRVPPELLSIPLLLPFQSFDWSYKSTCETQ